MVSIKFYKALSCKNIYYKKKLFITYYIKILLSQKHIIVLIKIPVLVNYIHLIKYTIFY